MNLEERAHEIDLPSDWKLHRVVSMHHLTFAFKDTFNREGSTISSRIEDTAMPFPFGLSDEKVLDERTLRGIRLYRDR